MASTQSEAVRKRWEMSRIAMMDPASEEVVDDESWGDLTAEPRGVDYLETVVGGLLAMWTIPKHGDKNRVLLCLHGGGFVAGSIYTHRKMFAHLAKSVGARALLVNYRLLSDGGTYPVPVLDVQKAYRWLLDEGFTASHIAVVGDSEGGWLAVAMQLRIRNTSLGLPAATLLMFPGVNMEANGQSYETNRNKDPFFTRELVRGLLGNFLGDTNPRDPLVNPLCADLSGLSPMYIQAGSDEALLDDSRLLEEHARRCGVEVKLDEFPQMLHTFQMAAGRAPEADDAIKRMAIWVRPKLGL